jgi:hypothetical protein
MSKKADFCVFDVVKCSKCSNVAGGGFNPTPFDTIFPTAGKWLFLTQHPLIFVLKTLLPSGVRISKRSWLQNNRFKMRNEDYSILNKKKYRLSVEANVHQKILRYNIIFRFCCSRIPKKL